MWFAMASSEVESSTEWWRESGCGIFHFCLDFPVRRLTYWCGGIGHLNAWNLRNSKLLKLQPCWSQANAITAKQTTHHTWKGSNRSSCQNNRRASNNVDSFPEEYALTPFPPEKPGKFRKRCGKTRQSSTLDNSSSKLARKKSRELIKLCLWKHLQKNPNFCPTRSDLTVCVRFRQLCFWKRHLLLNFFFWCIFDAFASSL